MYKTVQLIGALLLAGGPLFLSVIWRPALRAAAPPEPESLDAALVRWLRVGLGVGLALLALGILWELLAVAAALANASVFSSATWSQVGRVLIETDRGRLAIVRVVMALALWSAVRRIAAAPEAAPTRLWHGLAALAAVGLFLSFSLAGHAATVARSRVPAVAADLLHFLTAASWGGGIWYFAALPWRRLATAEGFPVAREIVRRFTILGLTAVALIIATGLFMSSQYIWGVPALFETRYGKDLLWKHILLVVILAAAMDNRYNVRLRLIGRAALQPERVVRSLRSNVWVEAVAITMVVVIAGFLTTASAETRRPVPVRVTIEGFAYHPSTIEIPRQKPVRLTVVNNDRVTHSLAVRNFPYEGPRSHAHDPGAVGAGDFVIYIPPRSRQSVVFTALEFGTYRIADVLEDYEDRGMTGTLIVK